QRAHIGVLLVVALQHQPLGGVDLGDRLGNLEIENVGGPLEPFGMLGDLENLAAVGALALEHAAAVMQRMGQHADLGVRCGHKLAVEPDQVRPLIERHRHDSSPSVTFFSNRTKLGSERERKVRLSGCLMLLCRGPNLAVFAPRTKSRYTVWIYK